MRLAKIVATLGPACASPAVLLEMVNAGLDVARLNFSHGEVPDHARAVARVRAAARRAGRSIAVLQDLRGPRIRLGQLPRGTELLVTGGRVDLVPARAFRAAAAAARGNAVLPTTYAKLMEEVHRGDRILLRDGAVELRVVREHGARVTCEVVRGGEVQTHSGINVPDSRLSATALTAKDRRDLAAGVRMGVDAVAVSFVSTAADVTRTKALLKKLGSSALVVAKIERKDALADLEAILKAADGVMVARGDLGVELAPESVPLLQKEIIRCALRSHTFVITATQMLESMVTNATPTRAEVSDVANAVLDGTDAVMLSAESAVGRHPVGAVATMDRILRHVEEKTDFVLPDATPPPGGPDDFIHALSGAAVHLAQQANAKALVPFTVSGRTAAALATWRPAVPILAYSLAAGVRQRLGFWRGVHAQVLRRSTDLEQMFTDASRDLLRRGLAAPGDALVFFGGRALQAGSSNTLKVHRLRIRDA